MDFENSVLRKNSDCYKYDTLNQKFGAVDLMPFWVADMDFVAAEPIVKALQDRMSHHIYGYTTTPPDFFTSIINRYQRQNITLQKEQILLTHGVVPALSACVQAFSKEQELVLFQPPVYHPFYRVVLENRRLVLENILILQGQRYEIDFDDLEQKLKQVGLLLLCHPHNPSGRLFNQDELSKIIDLCLEHQVILVSDEVHSEIVYQPHQFHSVLSFDKAHDIAIILDSASKAYNIAGLSTAYIVSRNHRLLQKLAPILEKYHIFPNLLGTYATIAAYNECQDWLEALMVHLQKNRDFAINYIKNQIPVLKPITPEATYLIWIDFNLLGQSHAQIQKRLIDNAKLALNSGTDFGGGEFFRNPQIGRGFFRLNIATSQSFLKQGLDALKQEFSTSS